MEIMNNMWEWFRVWNNLGKEKNLFFNQIEEVAREEKWLWLKERSIKRETESLIMAAQEQVIRTNTIKSKIDKTSAESECRLDNVWMPYVGAKGI